MMTPPPCQLHNGSERRISFLRVEVRALYAEIFLELPVLVEVVLHPAVEVALVEVVIVTASKGRMGPEVYVKEAHPKRDLVVSETVAETVPADPRPKPEEPIHWDERESPLLHGRHGRRKARPA